MYRTVFVDRRNPRQIFEGVYFLFVKDAESYVDLQNKIQSTFLFWIVQPF